MKPSLLAVTAFASAILPTSAAFVYQDTATTTGGEFSASFPIGNLNNAGHTSPLDQESADASAESYATTNPATGGFPVTITLEFVSATNLGKFYVWNHANNGAAGAPANGMGAFTLTFFDAPSAGGNQIGLPYSSTASAAPASGLYAAEQFDFGTLYQDVRSAALVITNKQGGSTSGFMAVREIGFDTIPEPGSVLLLGLGLGSFLVRRRR